MDEVIPLVPTEYRHKLVQVLSQAEDNEPAMLAAIHDAKPEQREAVAYLLLNMPDHDLKTMKEQYLLDNVELAYKAREATEFGKGRSKGTVLPIRAARTPTPMETREDWRKTYYDQFMPLVKDAKTTGEAAQILNKQVFPAIKVKYNATKRKQPIQSPFESASIHYASCTGLTIILADACRACGVPARMVGTPMWFDNSGNHTWTEIWNNQWHYVGSARAIEGSGQDLVHRQRRQGRSEVGRASHLCRVIPAHRTALVSGADRRCRRERGGCHRVLHRPRNSDREGHRRHG